MKRPQIIVIQGPTASGKTSLAVELAQELNCVVVSADSRQFYRELSIGTAKPSLEEMKGVKHYFIDSHDLQDEVSASQFATSAAQVIGREFANQKNVVIVGGSGLFIQALCEGLNDIPHDSDLQRELTKQVEVDGLGILLEELKMKDEGYFNQVDSNNPLRVIRAIEAMRLSGKTMTELRMENVQPRFENTCYFTIDLPREELYAKINLRVDAMMLAGLEEEARSVYHLRNLKSLQTVGYRELFDFFDAKVSREEAIELIKQHSRNYAKRQITWFKSHQPGIYLKGSLSSNLNEIKSNLRIEK
jgi:tRNA dimethylallyltransferase